MNATFDRITVDPAVMAEDATLAFRNPQYPRVFFSVGPSFILTCCVASLVDV